MLDLFSGIGGFSLAASWAGIETVAFCEIDPFCQKVLKKHWPDVPIYEDVRRLNDEKGIGAVDIICGGFPCPAFSFAGKRGGFKQDDLFFEMIRVCKTIRPKWIIFENVEGFKKWRHILYEEVKNIGYEWEDGILDARDFGIAQMRRRYFAICFQRGMLFDTQSIRRIQRKKNTGFHGSQPYIENAQRWWTPTIHTKNQWRDIAVNARKCRGHNGVPHRMDRLRALGNAIVPQVAYEIFKCIVEIEKTQ